MMIIFISSGWLLGTWGDIYVLFVFTIFLKEVIVWKVFCERVLIFLNLKF